MTSQDAKPSTRMVNRQTPQREQVLSIVERARGPLTAVEIYNLAREEIPDIGLSTVYRTLKLMQEEDKVRFVSLPDGVGRYEKAGAGRHHFQCRECQRIWTIQNGLPGALNGLASDSGFAVEDHNSTFYGKCPRCRD